MRASFAVFSLLVVAASASQASPNELVPRMVRRYVTLAPRLAIGGGGNSPTTTTPTTTPTTTTPTTTQPTTTPTSTDPTTTSRTSTTSSSSSSSSTRPTTTSYQSTSTATSTPSLTSSIDAAGSTVVITQTLSDASSSSSAALASATSGSSTSSSNGSHMGLIIGVSVAGGLVLIGGLIFLFMKFGGKRFSDYQDDDADIKWPELKADGDSAAMQPLPARRTGGAGFDMGTEFDEHEGDGQSMAEYGNTGRESMVGSSTALNAGVGAGVAGYSAKGAYGSGMDSAYHDDVSNGAGHYGQPAMTGYYDPYNNYSDPHGQSYYPDPQQEGYSDHHNQSDPYASARAQAASVSPSLPPYHVGGHSMHQGY